MYVGPDIPIQEDVFESDTHSKRSSRAGVKYVYMYMHIPCWAFVNVGQHLMDTKIDEIYSFEIIGETVYEIPIIEVDEVQIKIDLDETIYDAFISMFENITNYIHTENSITSIFMELYT